MPEVARGSMDFFAAQAAAKRRTGVLVILFALGWASTVLLADFGISLVLSRGAKAERAGVAAETGAYAEVVEPRDPTWTRFGAMLVPVALAVSAIVLAGTAWHAFQLGGDGGDAVARMLGGVPIERSTADAAERRAVNVLESPYTNPACPDG